MEAFKEEKLMKAVGNKMEFDADAFALSLKTWRLRKGWTQRRAAAEIGVSRYSIMRVENAQPCGWALLYKIFIEISSRML